MWAKAVGPDNGPDGSGIGQRLIPEEPMSIVLNLGISRASEYLHRRAHNANRHCSELADDRFLNLDVPR